jgi:NAD(P)-dependent dehydrogenase (short-subunit alcohol dehydrogenase family)
VPKDVARVAAFLASDESSYMTGESINLSGGLLMD